MRSFAEPDLIDRILDHLREAVPNLDDAKRARLATVLRAEFGGERTYVRIRPPDARVERQAEIVRLAETLPVVEVARRLHVPRGTVYRMLKLADRRPVRPW